MASTKKTAETTKAAPKAAAAKAASNGKAAPAPKVEFKGKALRSAQVRILKALAKARKALEKKELEAASEVNPAWTADMAGRPKGHEEVTARREASHGFQTLATLKLIKVFEIGGDDAPKETMYEILPAGAKVIS